MSLRNRLSDDMKLAMKSKDKFRLSVIRMVRSSIQNTEIDKKAELNDDEILEVLTREVKQRKDSLQEFKNANRDDLVTKLEQEIAVLMDYMPEQLTEAEIETLVQEAVAETGASSKKDMGKVMQRLMDKVKGKADGKVVNQIVQKFLQ
ncbi:GatB/YqeY domain-containing protein [Desulfuribacillus alkaliarsenatis]|uniref:Aspartyl-tRNA amidotransferase n=1 Tax=Desulfuribacillus alkaliarsenatis TaxID=766136 RepID=A0A1E5G0J6_9FIRM|nr:GatB/YqeY domain-containing protein [Desulfuribacillus alkaliarsenatis]OEF96229.1 aspartyl-tRNA amidotransferase [Desulfuribacillus alkaliarsenatis]